MKNVKVVLGTYLYADQTTVTWKWRSEATIVIGMLPSRAPVGSPAVAFVHELGHVATLPKRWGAAMKCYRSNPQYWECRAWEWAMQKYGADPVMRDNIRARARVCLPSYGVPSSDIEWAVRWPV